MRLLVFGYGYSARALAARLRGGPWALSATSRSDETRTAMASHGFTPVDPVDTEALGRATAASDAVLITAPPGSDGCPALSALRPHLMRGRTRWLGYLSTTGVYGDHGGGWVDERTPPTPLSPEARRRVGAEQGWMAAAAEVGYSLCIFRLPGIYGPGRSPLDRLRAGEARRLEKPGHVFSRIHVEDIAAGVAAALDRRERTGVFNLCDEEPAASSDVTAFAARLLGVEPPPREPFDAATMSLMAQRFWAESRRVANARAKAALGWRPAFPTYREGLAAILGAEG